VGFSILELIVIQMQLLVEAGFKQDSSHSSHHWSTRVTYFATFRLTFTPTSVLPPSLENIVCSDHVDRRICKSISSFLISVEYSPSTATESAHGIYAVACPKFNLIWVKDLWS